jgi:threonine aldolase
MSFWENIDETHTIMRIATSWATRPEDVERLIACL